MNRRTLRNALRILGMTLVVLLPIVLALWFLAIGVMQIVASFSLRREGYSWGWSLLGVVWGLALLGIAQEIWWARGARVSSLVIYVLMGWLALVAVVPLWQALTPAG